jgi:hypothetical protein
MRGHDALGTVLSQSETRVPDLVPIRMSRMSASPWTYYRGAAAVMAADLGTAPHTGIEVQLCGDAHVLNFWLWATPERQLSFDLRDFDETVRGPFEWDVKRYLASLVVLARDTGLDDRIGLAAVRAALRAYRDRIAHYSTADELTIWYDVITSGELLELFGPEEQEQLRGDPGRPNVDRRPVAEVAGRHSSLRGGHMLHDPVGQADRTGARVVRAEEDLLTLGVQQCRESPDLSGGSSLRCRASRADSRLDRA